MHTHLQRGFRSALTSSEGYTLIEILISVAIFSIGILAIAGLQTRATGTDTHSRLLTDAYTVAIDQVEEIMLWDYDSDGSSTYNGNDLTASSPPGTTYDLGNVGPGNRYDLRYTVQSNDGPDPPSNVKTITVQVKINQSTLPAVEITFLKAPVQDSKT